MSDPHIQAAAEAVHDFQVNYGPYEMEDVTLRSLHGSWTCDCEAKGAVAVRAWLASVGMTSEDLLRLVDHGVVKPSWAEAVWAVEQT